jgi:hypothetical protein
MLVFFLATDIVVDSMTMLYHEKKKAKKATGK